MFERKSSNPPETPGKPVENEVHKTAPIPQPGTNSRVMAMIGSTVKILGEIISDENLMIEGEVEGSISLKEHEVIVGNSGKVHASVSAKIVKIDGLVEGDVNAKEKVIISKSGNVKGNIVAPRVILEEGGIFKGNIDMTSSPAKAADAALSGVSSIKPSKPEIETAGKESQPAVKSL